MPAPIPVSHWSLTRAGIALVTTEDGTIDGCDATGLYVRDRRVVAGMEVRINGTRPVVLRGVRTGPSLRHVVYGAWGDVPDPRAIVERTTDLVGGYSDRFVFRCFREPLQFDVEIELTAGGATVYHLDDDEGGDEPRAEMLQALHPGDFELDGKTLRATVDLAPGQTSALGFSIRLDVDEPDLPPAAHFVAGDASTQRTIDQALWDLDALTVVDPLSKRSFIAAGAPHFLAVFGRDALVVSLLAMLAGTDRAIGVLSVLAEHQGRAHDDATLEAPGRIAHELRIGEMGVFGLDPQVPYYGSVDATPLFVVTLVEALRWGADPASVRELVPAARSAIAWCRSHADRFGFVPSIPHETGIGNQGWKDSGDSIVRPDGSVVEEMTSLVEVQGYVHAALLGLAELEEAVGDPASAPALRAEADEFRVRFARHFHIGGDVGLALALDAAGEPIAVRASNVGHLLATELIDDATAAWLADRLLSPAEFSGWGIRTLSADEAAYNPLGYHVGSVWPHDSAVFLRGLVHRGRDAEVQRVSTALLDLAAASGHSLPELLGGFGRNDHPAPIPYPASARPQAWAAAVPVQVIAARLGLRPELHRGVIRARPRVESGESIEVTTHAGGRLLTFRAEGRTIEMSGDTEGIDLIVE